MSGEYDIRACIGLGIVHIILMISFLFLISPLGFEESFGPAGVSIRFSTLNAGCDVMERHQDSFHLKPVDLVA
jgi:hypothetical protein